jgi:glycerol-3-phosphate dehydrogenase
MIKEHAFTAIDILMRRTTIGSGKTLGLESIGLVAEEMAKYNNWDNNRKNLEIKKYESYIDKVFNSFLN